MSYLSLAVRSTFSDWLRDTTIQFDVRAEERAVSLVHRTDRIQHRQIYQTELLESIESTSLLHVRQTSDNSARVQNSVENLSLQVQILQQHISDQLLLLVQLFIKYLVPISC